MNVYKISRPLQSNADFFRSRLPKNPHAPRIVSMRTRFLKAPRRITAPCAPEMMSLFQTFPPRCGFACPGANIFRYLP